MVLKVYLYTKYKLIIMHVFQTKQRKFISFAKKLTAQHIKRGENMKNKAKHYKRHMTPTALICEIIEKCLNPAC